jgi:tetratricopeptide (TPR) repeat protein
MYGKYTATILSLALACCLASCDKFLDVVPDNRTELDSDEKISKLLVSGYASHLFPLATEMMSDNVDEKESNYSALSRLQDQMYAWEDISETGNESPKLVWGTYYGAIAAANQVLAVIAERGNPARLNPQRGEALMIRAFHHFYLVNVFAKHYSEKTGGRDLGIPYIEAPETTVNPRYERLPVARVYELVRRDLEEALPLIDDNVYAAPKYHFNRKAAFAFAARFYLFLRNYDRVVECADAVLGENPEKMLRDFSNIPNIARTQLAISKDYIRPDHNANLLLMVAHSQLSTVFGNYSSGKKYMHSAHLANTETMFAEGPWGKYTSELFRLPTFSYTGGYVTQPKMPYLFEYTDQVAGIGYLRGVYTALQTDETLLCRAEARVMKGDFTGALKDLNLWLTSHTVSAIPLTRERINSFYSAMPFYTPEAPTPKKKINPEFTVTSEQENFLYCILQIRRTETIFEGLRWFDIKRFGIVVHRRRLDANNVATVQDVLRVDDPRRAIQLPAEVINAGLAPNPR